MADLKILDLTDGAPAQSTDVLPVARDAANTRRLSLANLATLFASSFSNLAHHARHENGGADQISVAGLTGLLGTAQTPAAHATSHQDGGSDEISVAALSGQLADAQKVTVRKNTGADVGTRARINFIEGTNITLTVADDAGNGEVDVTVAAAGASGAAVYNKSTGLTYNTDSAEHTIWSFTVTGNDLGATGGLICFAGGNLLFNSGSPTITVRIKYGATTLWGDVNVAFTASSTRRPWQICFILGNQNATNVQALYGYGNIGSVNAASVAGIGEIAAPATSIIATIGPFRGTSAEDSTANKTLALTTQMSVSNVADEIVLDYAVALKV